MSRDDKTLLPGAYIKYFLRGMGPAGIVKLCSSLEDKSCYA